jgi:hypothetical protein
MGRYGKIREEKGKRREEKYEESIVVCLSWYAFSVSAAI